MSEPAESSPAAQTASDGEGIRDFGKLAAELQDLSLLMQEFAQSAEWDRVVELEAMRLAVLHRAAEAAKRHGLIDAYAELLRTTIAANDALLACCCRAREQLGKDIRDQGMRRQLQNTYSAG
jgi:hypothetical protein